MLPLLQLVSDKTPFNDQNLPRVLEEQNLNHLTPEKDLHCLYRLHIFAELPWFKGHFPGFPLIPGVVQIHWAMYFAGLMGLNGRFSGVKRMKFMKPIQPNDELMLEIKLNSKTGSFSYRYYADECYSSGIVTLNG